MATEVLLYLVIVLLIMQVVFIGIVINLQMKHKRMQAKYQIFMRGKDGKSLEKGFLEQFKTVEKLESAGQWTDTEELNALRADYSAAISRAELAEQEQEERTQVNDLITAFLNAYFLLPDSREALLSGCEEYVSKDAWRTIELLSDSRDYNEAERELFYYQGDCTELEDEDSQYHAFAIFTIQEIENGEANDQSYMLAATVETDGTAAKITDIETMTAIYFHAD